MSWKSTLRRFIVNEAANFGLIFALSSPVLVGGAVAAVETTTLIRSRVQLQNALDAAALATGKHLAETTDEGELEAYARDFFDANLHPGLDRNRVTLQFNLIDDPNAAKRIRLEADYDYPRVMGSLFGADDITLDIGSEVTAGNKTIEVAIVIDNSGSMNSYTGGSTDTRLEKAQEAAKALATQLFSLTAISNKTDPVRISVVPFASSVNIGAANRGAGWMDMNGWSSIHHENLDWEATAKRGDDWPFLQPLSGGWKGMVDGANTSPPSGGGSVTTDWLTRWSLFDAIDVDWAGCVEMRPWPHHARDTTPSSLDPDTLFVPMFAPDEPERLTSREDRDYTNDYLDEYRRAYSHSLTYNYYGRHYLEYYIPGEGYNYHNYTRQHWRQGWTMKYNMDARLSNLGTFHQPGLWRLWSQHDVHDHAAHRTDHQCHHCGYRRRRHVGSRLHQHPGRHCLGMACSFGRRALHPGPRLWRDRERQVHHRSHRRQQHLPQPVDPQRFPVHRLGLREGWTRFRRPVRFVFAYRGHERTHRRHLRQSQGNPGRRQ